MRYRLLLWSGLLLFGIIAGFGGVPYAQVRANRFAEVDAELEASARLLEGTLRNFPRPLLEGFPSVRPPLLPRPPGVPGPLPPEHFLKGLNVPSGRNPAAPPLYFVIWTADGQILKASPLPPEAPPVEELARGFTLPALTAQFRQRGPIRECVVSGPSATLVLVGRAMHPELGSLHLFLGQIVLAGLVALAVGLVGIAWVARRTVRPLVAMSQTAASITATNLSERLDTANADRELAQLGEILNATFERLENAFAQQVRFTADASHELRTPLAVLLSHLELALSRPRSPEEYRQTLATCQRAAQRMQSLTADLLTLARADAGKLELTRERIDLALLVEEIISLLEPLADQQRVRLTCQGGSLEAVADPDRLSQVLANLLTNAILYNRPGGQVDVSLHSVGECVEIRVRDTGHGIAAEHLPHLFERFYRVDAARARERGGCGLGLAICHSIVSAHGGTIDVTSEPGVGSIFSVKLPGKQISS